MKLSRIASLLAGIGILAGVQVAHAYDGTVNFTGAITDQTCTINGDTTPVTQAVGLGTVNADQLASAGATTGWTSFNIELTNCPATSSARAQFLDGTGVNAQGRLVNTGSAGNVDIALRDGNAGSMASTNIVVGNSGTAGAYVPLVSGAATLTYWAGFYATAAATVGSVEASVTYSITYQ